MRSTSSRNILAEIHMEGQILYLFIYKVVERSCDPLATSLKRSLNVLTKIVHPWTRLSHVIGFDQLQQRGEFAIAYK